MSPLPSHFVSCVRTWWLCSLAWYIGYFVLGTLAILLPAIVASGLIEDIFWTKVIALAASAISGLQLFLKCDLRASQFHLAWRKLITSTLRYEHEEDFPIAEVINAYSEGEKLVGGTIMPVDAGSNRPPQSK